MKLIRLKLECWRGVEHREIEFADEVTLIEGPNEVGKSTIVEAIHMLFREMDSSNKQAVKAIQPVGQDVGSTVEAEVMTGDYHFTYSKTYNKGKQTSLKILAPNPDQLTGREAHERADQILDETIDTVLWDALLLEQGKEIGGVDLADSTGLARALDAAAGTSSESPDDSALFTAVQSEFEQYFSLKTGKSRLTNQETELETLRNEVEAIRSSLAEVEEDAVALERAKNESKRLEGALPDLKRKVGDHESAWQEVEALSQNVDAKAAELKSADDLFEAVTSDLQRRQSLASKLAENAQKLVTSRSALTPAEDNLTSLQIVQDNAVQALKEAKDSYQAARTSAERAATDEKYLGNVESLRQVEKQLEQVAELGEELAGARSILKDIRIDAAKLEDLRKAERELHIAKAKRDASALTVEVTAQSDLELGINDEQVALSNGESARRSSAAEIHLQLPGMAAIRVFPSQSAGELETELERHQTRFDALLSNAGVHDLADAVAVENRRMQAEQEVRRCLQKTDEILKGESLEELQVLRGDLQRTVESYIADRPELPLLPENLTDARKASATAGELLADLEESVSSAEVAVDEAREQLDAARAELYLSDQEMRGLETIVEEQKRQLAEAQYAETDAALDERLKQRLEKKTLLQNEFSQFQQRLESASPDSAKALLENSRNTLRRAEKDLQHEQQRCAVLEDRLAKAQADGRFESLENAVYKLSALEADYSARRTRALAVERLWNTISRHRDSARKAYVKPLKEGIERLGRIVFGADFEIELGDDWRLVSRTQAGKTISFDDLSVGTKEQLGILTRLAAAGVVAEQGGVPLMIDDALGFSDPGRLESMGAAIASAGKDCQVILLTCTPGRFMHVGSAEIVRL